MDETKTVELILRERAVNNRGVAAGWTIIRCGPGNQREVLVVFSTEVGLEYARKMAQVLAHKYGLTTVREQLGNYEAVEQVIDAAYKTVRYDAHSYEV